MATVEEKLRSLWNLQSIDKQMDNLRAVRGELPMEVADLEDDIAGLKTRLVNFEHEIEQFESAISGNKERISQAKQLEKKYNEQLNSVKNNREYDALTKEIEIQGLEVLAAEKKIGELQNSIVSKKELIEEVKHELDGRNIDLDNKKKELEEITGETEKEESKVGQSREKTVGTMDEKLFKAYDRIRKNVFNGLAVAPVLRGSCGGCFAKIPPQLQSDIRQRKKIVICEHCGRINVDSDLAGIVEEAAEEKPKSRRRRKAD
ncbi:MAG: hypothetical protein H6607_00575 [Flavobacteriales bacterium]|nr:hypothetical protein [Flavobacteriales bacterium]